MVVGDSFFFSAHVQTVDVAGSKFHTISLNPHVMLNNGLPFDLFYRLSSLPVPPEEQLDHQTNLAAEPPPSLLTQIQHAVLVSEGRILAGSAVAIHVPVDFHNAVISLRADDGTLMGYIYFLWCYFVFARV